jgi:hypothetical protein
MRFMSILGRALIRHWPTITLGKDVLHTVV